MAEYISREEVLEKLTTVFKLQASTAKAIIESIPAADVVERKHGKWIEDAYVERSAFGRAIWHKTFRCSECGGLFGRKDDNFCYNCGADMRGEEDG